ncbi:M20 metallopeptidase family protein [Tenacibaculum xiamenense]|uniref:M20 metallopeptidase family protein n=1 Tax=Tenacibaculum xiamenense TaxID=1261553 RepID=UPI00389324B4
MIKRIRYLKVALIVVLLVQCKVEKKRELIQRSTDRIDEIYDDLIAVRRDLHRYPEVSGEEIRTAKIVAHYLRSLGLEVISNIAGNSVVGILKGKEKGKRIAWRADLDAIKIETNDTVHFHSRNKGIAHMCGHDVHTTIGLGIADVLSQEKENLKGTVYFIFQASEETFTGARELVENGLFDSIQPEEIYGLHIGPAEKGIVNTKVGELFAYEKELQIKFKHEKESIIKNFLSDIMAGFIRNKPNTSPNDLTYLIDAKVGIEAKETMYTDYFILRNLSTIRKNDLVIGTINFYETNKERIDLIPLEIQEKINRSKFKESLISIKYTGGNPTVYNNKELTKEAFDVLTQVHKPEQVKPMYGQIPYFNEDFIYYQQKIPGVFFLLGGSNKEKGIISMPHTPNFAVDEEVIKIGVNCFSKFILQRINKQ